VYNAVGNIINIIYKSAKTHVKEKRACKSFSLVGFLQEQPVERREHANSCRLSLSSDIGAEYHHDAQEEQRRRQDDWI
jgi:hypothetical protein